MKSVLYMHAHVHLEDTRKFIWKPFPVNALLMINNYRKWHTYNMAIGSSKEWGPFRANLQMGLPSSRFSKSPTSHLQKQVQVQTSTYVHGLTWFTKALLSFWSQNNNESQTPTLISCFEKRLAISRYCRRFHFQPPFPTSHSQRL